MRALQSFLHLLPPEIAHTLAVRALYFGWVRPRRPDKKSLGVAIDLRQTICGLDFPNPLGMAAGFDKDACVPNALARLGFGFVEIGSVTPRPQAGNPKPRLFRLREDRAIINRMGFNNDGAMLVRERLWRRFENPAVKPDWPLGVNLGANKDSEDRIGDYVLGLETFWDCADYFTINVSSPNTPGLRALQEVEPLRALMGRLNDASARQRQSGTTRPIFLKLSPDMDEELVTLLAQTLPNLGVDGVILTNTTLARPDDLRAHQLYESGGLSGRPLKAQALRVLRIFRAAAPTDFPIISVGGIESAQDVWERLQAGANLVQLYTAFIYGGADLPAQIVADLARIVRNAGFTSLQAALAARK